MNHRASFYFNKGCQLFAARHFVEAESEIRVCFGLCPEDAEVLNALGTILDAQGRYDEALACYRDAISRDSSNSVYYFNLGKTLRRTDETVAAESAYRAALDHDPSFAEALLELGSLYLELSHFNEARPLLEQFLQFRPDHPDGLYDLGQVALGQGCFAEAERHFSAALAIEPDKNIIKNSLGVALLRLNRYDEAREFFIDILGANPDSRDALSNLAVYYHWSGRVESAIDCYEKLLALAPDDAEAHFNQSLALLAAGRFEEGWRKYEWRFCKGRPIPERHSDIPRWSGQAISGKKLLVHGEQGYGDSIQFIRYAQLVHEEGAAVFVEGQDRRITPLLRTASGVSEAFQAGETLPPVDFQIPMMSLPLALGDRFFPPPFPPYFNIPAEAMDQWRNRFSSCDGLKVGLAWAGNKDHGNNHNRSVLPALLEPLGNVQGVTFVSLQFGSDAFPVFPLLDYTGEAGDFLQSAALASCLDLVITIDSAVAHLAGALAIPVWLMLPYNNDWRWMRDRNDSPWYPSMRLFRQESPGAWEPLLNNIAIELARLAGSREMMSADQGPEPVVKSLDDLTIMKAGVFEECGCLEQAIIIYKNILLCNPENLEAAFRLALLYMSTQKHSEALPLLRMITTRCHEHQESWFQLGSVYAKSGDFLNAIDSFNEALQLGTTHIRAHGGIGRCLSALNRYDEAYQHFNEAIVLSPENPEGYNNLGNLFVRWWRNGEAYEQYQHALALKPDFADALCNLGLLYNLEGRIDEAMDCFNRSLSIKPDLYVAADNLLMLLNYSDVLTPEFIRDEHLRLAAILPATALVAACPRKNNGHIRIGYVSADFRGHSVGFFIEPVLRCHDQGRFEVVCYDCAAVSDEFTERMKASGVEWRHVFGLSDTELASQIKADAVDVLVDLSGHTDGNRLGAFALRPAQVQVTWLGYPNTTGLQQIDYRLTDPLTDPPGRTDDLYSEQLVRLPRSFICYSPPPLAPEIAPLPGGPIIFCSFNHLAKVSDTTIDLWSRLLHLLPEARFSLKNGPLSDQGVRERLLLRFSARGIDSTRLIISGHTASREEHLNSYNKCHIALDTFPYCGTTTTCEALWMGVPVVTLAGNTHVSRVGASILQNAGLPELVASNADEYVNRAAALARDHRQLQKYRLTLRETVSRSQLMNAPLFTADLEYAYLRMMEYKDC